MRYRGCAPAKKVGQGYYWRLADVVAWRAKNLHAEPSGPGAERAGAKGLPASIGPVPRGTYEDDDVDGDGESTASADGMPGSVIEADLRLKHARTQLAQLELKKRAEELVSVQDVREAWSRRVTAAKRLLESLAPAVAQDVCAACTLGAEMAPKIERVVGDAFAQTLQRLASQRGPTS